MALIVKLAAKNFNGAKLQEELASLPITSIGWAGFVRASARVYTPAAARRKVGEAFSNGQRTEDFADPGELRFHTSRDLTPVEDDLILGSLSVDRERVRAGSEIRVTDITKNHSRGAAGASTTRFYLSTDAKSGDRDIPLGSRAIPSLAPEKQNSGTTRVSIPGKVKSGKYYIIGVADADGGVKESNEKNNWKSEQINVLHP